MKGPLVAKVGVRLVLLLYLLTNGLPTRPR